MIKNKPNYQEVQNLYGKSGLTFREIAEQFGCGVTTVRKIAKRHGLQSIRGKSKHRKIIVQKSDILLSLNKTKIMRNMDKRISSQQLEMILGGLLGDSYLRRRKFKTKTSYNVLFAHSEKQIEYLKFKRNILNNIANEIRVDQKPKEKNVEKGIYKSSTLFAFSTKTLDLEYLYNMLIINNKKTISRNYLDLLTPLSLSIWYMDDGNYNSSNRICRFATMCFSKEGNEIIRDYFYENLKMPCFIERTNCGSGYSICLTQNSTKKFLKLVSPYRCPSMEYKFPHFEWTFGNPVETLKAEKSVSKEDYANNLNIAGHPEKIRVMV